MSQDERYRQLGLFGIIIGYVTLTPFFLGAAVFKLLEGRALRMQATVAAALFGLCVGFYRVYLLTQKKKENEPGTK